MTRVAVLAVVVGLLVPWTSVTAAAQPSAAAPGRIDVSALGPKVGERVPDFSLRDQDGRARDLRSIVGRRGAMVVFIRSADW